MNILRTEFTFLQNIKILNLWIRCHILWSYCFVAEVTFNIKKSSLNLCQVTYNWHRKLKNYFPTFAWCIDSDYRLLSLLNLFSKEFKMVLKRFFWFVYCHTLFLFCMHTVLLKIKEWKVVHILKSNNTFSKIWHKPSVLLFHLI